MQQRTLGIIKPDAFKSRLAGAILGMAQENQLSLVGAKVLHFSPERAEGFYHVHRDKGFFESLTRFMSEGPIMVLVFEGEGAIEGWRKVMGATDPAQAEDGTIRKQYGENIERNAVHGSDSPESARSEIGYFFSAVELI